MKEEKKIPFTMYHTISVIDNRTLIANKANGEYHPRKHTKQSYRSQQRAAKKRRK